jgi:cytochrome c oxidase accessory protein FixG
MSDLLPLVDDQVSSLRADGRRNFVVPADVSGRFHTRRLVIFAALIAIYVLLPWIEVGGHPAVFLDLQHRAFYLFGFTFNAQDVWMAFFLLSGTGFVLIFIAAMLGRLWCGYACPQTVFLDGVFRHVDRFFEGPRNVRLKRDKGPFTFDKAWRKLGKHGVFAVLAFLVAHIFLSYFVSLPALFEMVRTSPAEHPEAFAWAFGMTGFMYFNFAWFREQLCLVICPYGRLQSVLSDQDTMVIGYDTQRGEPRGKAKGAGIGDCVDCGRCVAVCPTGIDIRNGLQIDCIGCSGCIDACDEVMDKLKRPRGLVRYDSLNGLAQKPKRFMRPRFYLYLFLGLLGLVVASFSLARHKPFEANLLRLPGAAYAREGERVRNTLELHLVNKHGEDTTFDLSPAPGQDIEYVIAQPHLTVKALGSARIPVFIYAPDDKAPRKVAIIARDGKNELRVEAVFLAPH